MQEIHPINNNNNVGRLFNDRRLRPQNNNNQQILKCPRCESSNTKFCYYNNYNLSQPRHFCKNCRRYWTKGGVLRNVPVGGGCRKSKKSSKRTSSAAASPSPSPSEKTTTQQHSLSLSSSESSSNNTITPNVFQIPDAENFDIRNNNSIGEFINLYDGLNHNNYNSNSNGNGNGNNTGSFWSGHVAGDKMGSGFEALNNWDNPTVENGDHGLFDFTSTVDHNQDYWTQQTSSIVQPHINWSHNLNNDNPLFLP